MSLSASMLVGFSGIKSNTVMVDTVGDNLANLNTTAFKGQRTLFETLMYHTIDEGEAPSDSSGGTLPFQIGSGSRVAVVQRDFSQGSLESTPFPSDLAIDGEGFFILESIGGDQRFTRDGSFHLDETQTLVSSSGDRVQVFPADAAGGIDTGSLSGLVIPLGSLGPALPTTQVVMEGRLDPSESVAVAPAVAASQPLVTANGTAAADTPLTDLVGADGLPLMAEGDELTIRASKGGIAIQEAAFVVGRDGATLGALAGFLEQALGIQTGLGTEPAPGVRVSDGSDAPAGALVITSNLGRINAADLSQASITNTSGSVSNPFAFSTVSEAVGGGAVTTSFNAFDSLGQPVDVRLRLVLESKSDAGTTWRFFAESVGDSDLSPALGTGTVSFDDAGQFLGATDTQPSIDRAATGATTPAVFELDFSRLIGLANPDGGSELVMASQDGAPPGVLLGFAIDQDGLVVGTYSNQTTEVFGQIALATFTNNEGLIGRADNTFVPGVNSGEPTIVVPRTGIAGAVRSGWLEQSNVEIAREFINLIGASTGITSAGRVVRVADELLQELLLLAR